VARLPRFVLAGQPHYIVQQGHNGQPIVADDIDRQALLALLRDAAVTHKVDVHAWALLPGSVQLLATPRAEAAALSRMMQTLGRRYVAQFNRRHGRSGTLFDGRFRLALLEPGRWLLDGMRFVEHQARLASGDMGHAVEADGAGDDPGSRWSSAAHHLGLVVDPLVNDAPAFWALGNTPFEREAAWRRLSELPLPADCVAALSAAARRGRPLGSREFIAGLQGLDNERLLTSRPRGRPRKRVAAG
jgi:putative transposase